MRCGCLARVASVLRHLVCVGAAAEPRGAHSAAAVEWPRRLSGRRQPSVTTTEASWHRRARRQRQLARAFLALDRARRVLSAHHGGGGCSPDLDPIDCASCDIPVGMPYGKGAGFTNWDCHICGKPDNHGSRTRCRECEAYPRPGARRPLGGGKGAGGKKGGGGGGKNGNPGQAVVHNGFNASSKNSTHIGDYAERQLQIQRTHQAQAAFKSSEKLLQDQRRRNEALLEQNRKLMREMAEVKGKRDLEDDDEDMEEGPEELSVEDRKAKIDKIRAGIPYLEEQFGPESELLKEAQSELELHSRAIRETKPYKTHRTIVERKVERLKKQQEKDRERLSELRESAEEIKGKIAATESAITDRERELEAAESELKELLLRAVGEEGVGSMPPPGVDPSQGWDSVVQTVAQLTRLPGVPPEVAGQLDGLFGQLRHMVSVLQIHATSVGAATPAATTAAATPTAATAAAPTATTNPSTVISSPSATSVPSPTAPTADELRRQQRLARAQCLQTAAIADFERNYRQAQRAANSGLGESAVQQDHGDRPPQHPSAQQATPPQQPPPTETSEQTVAPAAAAAGSAAGGGGLTDVPNSTAPTLTTVNDGDDDDSDITGTISEGERENMEIDALVAAIPSEQREGVRTMLEKSKIRRARRFQRRLKKPVIEEAGVPRNPKK